MQYDVALDAVPCMDWYWIHGKKFISLCSAGLDPTDMKTLLAILALAFLSPNLSAQATRCST